jgi:hypothetical protein
MWFTNATGWGTLAGLMAWAGSGSESLKLKYGLLVGGETAGIAAGIWGARALDWTPQQVLMANSLVVGGGLGLVGLQRWRDPNFPLSVSPAAGYGTAPMMLVSAFAARELDPTTRDVNLAAVGAVEAAWTAGLVGSGLANQSIGAHEGQGGLLAGLGLGYLGATAAGAFTEVPIGRTYVGALGMLTGNLLGTGVAMMAAPTDDNRWKLGAGIGGAVLGTAAFAGYYHLAPGERAPSMTTAGALYGVVPWTLALQAASTGQPADARVSGGQLAFGTAGGIAGYLAARHFQPTFADQLTVGATTAAGMGMGLGLARLTTADQGLPDFAGVLGGAAVGFVGGTVLTRYAPLRAPEIGGAAAGAGYGLLFGSLLPTLGLDEWNDGRRTDGGSWLGVSAGAVAGTALARALHADGGEVAVPTVAGVFGLGAGLGTGLLWPSDGSQSTRIGAVAGPAAFMTASMLAEPWLHLGDGLGPSATGLALSGVVGGGAYGALVGMLVAPDGLGTLPERQHWGSVLAGASVGSAAGLVLSKRLEPTPMDYLTTISSGVLGTSLGAGVAALAFDQSAPDDRHGPAFALGGATLGLVGGALVSHTTQLRALDLGAGFAGLGYGALVGTLVPSLTAPTWDGGPHAAGGAGVGLAIGAAGATAIAHATDASGAQVGMVSVAGGLGTLTGLGLGLMLPDPTSQPARIGTVAGTLSYAALSVALDRPLRLHEGFGPSAPGLGLVGGAVGATEGVLLAAAIGDQGLVSATPARQTLGGALFGATAGLTSGLLLSKAYDPTAEDDGVALGGTVLGGLLARGVATMATDQDGRAQTIATLSGSLAGLGAAAAFQHRSPMTDDDVVALPVGLGFGGLAGALAPSLGDRQWNGWQRREDGGVMAGLAAGGLLAVAARHATGAPASTVGWTAFGGADGALTGLGVGLLVDDDTGSRAARLGTLVGAGAGLGIGAALWPRLSFAEDDRMAVTAAIGVGGWTGLWATTLGHADAHDVSTRTAMGGLLAGAGGTSFVAMSLVPRLHVDLDLVENALLVDALLTGAGAGAGALASPRDDAVAWGVLGAGTAGLVLGGALHRRIELDEDDVPLVSLAAIEGTWYGAWLPRLLLPPARLTDRQQAGGVFAGALGATAAAIVASPFVDVSARTAGFAGLGSAIGASVSGGASLLSNADAQTKTGILLGGTTVGLAAGALLAPRLELREGAPFYGMTGAALGATEGLVFAWAGRGSGTDDYMGGLLVGAGVGTTLGLATAAYPSFTLQRGLASAGYAAWGAWVGSFSGALLARDPHEVTLGGLAGANAGFLLGYGLLRTDLVEPRDFGWLSLAGAVGTVAGGGVGAALSNKTDPRPILAGLAIGPVVGMAGGALLLPRLRHLSDRATASFCPSRTVAGMQFEFPARAGRADASTSTETITSADVLADKPPPSLLRQAARRLDQLVGVETWTPMVGSLPQAPGDPAPAPFIIGVAGTLR